MVPSSDYVPEPQRPQPQFEPIQLQVDRLNQQLDDARLLGGEQLAHSESSRSSASDRALEQLASHGLSVCRFVAGCISAARVTI